MMITEVTFLDMHTVLRQKHLWHRFCDLRYDLRYSSLSKNQRWFCVAGSLAEEFMAKLKCGFFPCTWLL